MASLYDLELQETNNFIHSLLSNGQPLALKMMEDQKVQFKAMGAASEVILQQMEDPKSEIGASYQKLKKLEIDLKASMTAVAMTSALAQKAQEILTKNPKSLADLSEDDKKTVQDYWLKKKSIVAQLTSKGYTPQDLFS